MIFGNPILLVAGLLAIGLAVAGLFRPFLGLLVLMTLHFIQPAELVPALAPLRLELVYGVAIFAILLAKKGGEVMESMKADPVLRGTLLLLCDVGFTIPFAIWRGGAFNMFLSLTKLIILQIVMTVFIDTQDRLRKILWLLIGFMMWFVGTTFSAFIHGQFYALHQTFGTINRAEGVSSMVGDPNELAGILLAFLPFLMALMNCTKYFLVKVFLAACGVLTLYVLGLTGARIVILALIPIGLYYVLRSQRVLVNLGLAVALAISLWSTLPREYQDRILTVKSYAEGGQLDGSNEFRLQIWRAGWRMFLDHPILGVGAGQFPTAYGTEYSGRAHGAWMDPHNLYLQVACELGIVGFSIFMYFLWQIWKAIREGLHLRGLPGLEINYQFAVACSLMFIGNAFIGVVSHTLYRPYWYLLAGLVVSNRLVARHILATKTATDSVPGSPARTQLPSRRLHLQHDRTVSAR